MSAAARLRLLVALNMLVLLCASTAVVARRSGDDQRVAASTTRAGPVVSGDGAGPHVSDPPTASGAQTGQSPDSPASVTAGSAPPSGQSRRPGVTSSIAGTPETIPPLKPGPLGSGPHTSTVHSDAVAYQLDAGHSGSHDDALAPNLRQLWSLDLGGHVGYPIIAGGRVFAATSGEGEASKLYALSAASGGALWGPVALAGDVAGIAYETHRVFVLTYQAPDGVLQAFEAASGLPLWSIRLPGNLWAAPTAFGGTVYAVASSLYAVDETSGAIRWSAAANGAGASSPAISSDGVYLTYSCELNEDFDPSSGALIWQHSPACSGGGGFTSAVHDGQLWARDYGGCYCAGILEDAHSGKQVGNFTTYKPSAFYGSYGYFMNGHRDGCNCDATLEANSPASSPLNAWGFGGDGYLTSAPIAVNGSVFIASINGNLYELDGTTGVLEWSTNVGSPVLAPHESGNAQPAGLSEGDGLLVVPATTRLVAYG
jgi:outer membrane protein assembly factor BamB